MQSESRPKNAVGVKNFTVYIYSNHEAKITQQLSLQTQFLHNLIINHSDDFPPCVQ